MSQPFRPFRRRAGQAITRRPESPWARAWRLSPERMREHISRLNEARTAKSEEAAQLVQAVLNLIPTEVTAPTKSETCSPPSGAGAMTSR
jgi:hypothetical protein